jgi:hypothetical protein
MQVKRVLWRHATGVLFGKENMKSKIKTILLTILIFSFVELVLYIGYSFWDIEDGLSGNRNLTEQEFSDIAITLNDYFNSQENTPVKYEITFSYFAKAIYDNPISNQYIVYVDCFYENEKRHYGFSMLKGLKKYYIDTVGQYYVPSEDK